MATTTNYGWTTPDDTALVKDGASAIRTLGSSIDTTLKAQIDAQIPDSLLTTTGDIIYASGASTPARLPIGTTGQILNVSGGLPAWTNASSSGGMTLLSTTSLSGASVVISSINQTYKNLYILIYGVTNATADGDFQWRPLSSITAVVQTYWHYGVMSSTRGVGRLAAGTDMIRTGGNNAWAINIQNYASTANYKPMSVDGVYQATGTSSATSFTSSGGIYTNSAITSIELITGGGNLSTGTALIYGVN